jgi:hypothetical protein
MRVGIVAEGRGDLAVLVNILKGWSGIEFKNVQFLRPEYSLDETDLHEMSEEKHSNWLIVRDECIAGERIAEFLGSPIAGERIVVIQLDTAEAGLAGYDVNKPTERSGTYAAEVRRLVIEKINQWLAGRFSARIRYAVPVEETDAWVLTIYSKKETDLRPNPKKDLHKVLNEPNRFNDRARKKLFNLSTYEKYDTLTQPFRKTSTLDECANRSRSLRLFLDSFERAP